MGLLNGLIAILTIKILLLRVNIWHVSAIPFVPFHEARLIPLFKLAKVKQVERNDSIETFNNLNCSELISRNISKVIPYTDIFSFGNNRTPLYDRHIFGEHPLLRVRTRIKYKTEFHTIWTCCEGYVQRGSICVPHCPQSCVKGTCKEPDVCTCNKGYRMSPNTNLLFGDCVPECTNGCVHGTCVEPEICHCDNGYFTDSDGSCQPLCDAECERKNGHCSEPNVCTCRPSYRAISEGSSFTCETLCNKGYILVRRINNDTMVTKCEPFCANGCFNGLCIKPGLCSCNPGFVYDETNQTCKPHCERSCGPHGECTSPNNCTCFEGYYKVFYPSTWPEFLAPTMLKLNLHVCKPKCEIGCFNGRCTAPNTCTCFPGFYPLWIESPESQNNTEHFCERLTKPPCNALSCGNNASCHETGVCICDKGYSKDTDGVCVPFCPFECPNGTCTAPHLCACHDGFALRNDKFCDPICERGCQNGDCIGPNECVCHKGFIPNTDHHSSPECIPVCTRNCSGHGQCIIDHGHDYKCECHFGWTGRDCDQLTVCLMTMAYDHDDVNRITIHNDTNSSIILAYENAPYCYQCDNNTILSLDNETLCYVMTSKDGNISNFVCLLKTDFLCYMKFRYDTPTNVTVIVWSLILAILLITGLTVTVYIMYRKHQKKKLAIAGTMTNRFVRESISTELLLSDT